MEPAGIHTKNEILSQPQVWADALGMLKTQAEELAAFYQHGEFDHVVLTGCGSTYYLSLAAASLIQELCSLPARGLPASEIWLSPHAIPPGSRGVGNYTSRTLLVAVSRSGETTETILACQEFLERRSGNLLTLTCVPESRLARLGQINLTFPTAMEKSIAQTRAFSTLYLATVFLAGLWSGQSDFLNEMERLPEAGRRLLEKVVGVQNFAQNEQAQNGQTAGQLGRNPFYDRFYFLGSGPRYGLACELSLKMKEMSLSHSEPFYFLEFRHGPQSMVSQSTLLIGLLGDQSRAQEERVLEEMGAKGARLFRMAESGGECSFASGIRDAFRHVLYLPAGQWLAFNRALSRGMNPDRPYNLDAVVRLDH